MSWFWAFLVGWAAGWFGCIAFGAWVRHRGWK